MNEVIKTLTLDKETKGTVRYSDGDGLNVYLKKDDISFPNHPQQVRLVISAA